MLWFHKIQIDIVGQYLYVILHLIPVFLLFIFTYWLLLKSWSIKILSNFLLSEDEMSDRLLTLMKIFFYSRYFKSHVPSAGYPIYSSLHYAFMKLRFTDIVVTLLLWPIIWDVRDFCHVKNRSLTSQRCHQHKPSHPPPTSILAAWNHQRHHQRLNSPLRLR